MAEWNPEKIVRVVEVLETSTKPVIVETDQGMGLLKYLGNPQGTDALIAEMLAGGLAGLLSLPTPDHSLLRVGHYDLSEYGVQIHQGTAFISRWMSPAMTFAPKSAILSHIRDASFVSRLVVFDTWIKNNDRFSPAPGDSAPNYDNLLFIPDKRKAKALVIDHTHAFVETTFEEEMSWEDWWADEVVFGVFPNFAAMIDQNAVVGEIEKINEICENGLYDVIRCIPQDWNVSHTMRQALHYNLTKRAAHLLSWLPAELFNQQEMNYRGER